MPRYFFLSSVRQILKFIQLNRLANFCNVRSLQKVSENLRIDKSLESVVLSSVSYLGSLGQLVRLGKVVGDVPPHTADCVDCRGYLPRSIGEL